MEPVMPGLVPGMDKPGHDGKHLKENKCWMPTNCFGHKLPQAFAC